MWIFLNDAFLSIVDKEGDGTTPLVRAREEGDIEWVYPDAKVIHTPHNDYPCRARIDRERVAERIADSVRHLRRIRA